jgi:hypothetical protein
VLFGVANLLVVFMAPHERFSLLVLLSASSILWAGRSILQILYPQVSCCPTIQNSLLLLFILVFSCFGLSLWLVWFKKSTSMKNNSQDKHEEFRKCCRNNPRVNFRH